jgi:hypothetical protein
MGFSNWRMPEISDETEFALRVQELRAHQDVKRDPETVVKELMHLARQNAALEVIVEKATRRIIELEAAAAVAPPPESRCKEGTAIVYWGGALFFLGLSAIGGGNPLNLVLLLGLFVLFCPGGRG